MESIYKRIYEVVVANNSIFTNKGLEPIRTIDKFRGQTTRPEQFEIFETPALFIAVKTSWKLDGNVLQGTTTVDLHLVIDMPEETALLFTNHDEALEKLFYYTTLQKLIDGLAGEDFTRMVRAEENDIDTGVWNYTVLTYQCTRYDKPNNNNYITIDDAVIEIQNKRLVKNLA